MKLTTTQAATVLRLLTDYANSGVSDSVSLECAQMCAIFRAELTPAPAPPAAPAQAGAGGES